MLIYSSNYTLRHLLKKLKEIIDIIYTTFSRRPYKLLKDRIVMTAQEAADSVGVKLVDED